MISLKEKNNDIKELIESFQNDRSSQLWEQVYKRYHQRIYRFNLSMGVKKEDAQDLMQDVLIKVHHQINTLNNLSSFEPWLFKIAHNMCINHMKAESKHPNVELESIHYKHCAQYSEDDYEREKTIRQKYDRVSKLLRKLPYETQHMINLKYLENYTSRAMMEVFNLSESAIKMRLFRARKKVRLSLQQLPATT